MPLPPLLEVLAGSLILAVQDGAGGTAAPADGTGTPSAAPKSPFGLDSIGMLLAFVAIFYFLMWRPQAKERKARAAMLGAVKKGDRVILTCGLMGEVAALTEHEVLIKFDDKDARRLRFKRYAIHLVVKDDEAAPVEAAAAESK